MSNEPSSVNPPAGSALTSNIGAAADSPWQQQVEQLQAQLCEREMQRAREAETARQRQLALEDELRTRQNLNERHRSEIEALQERLERQQLDLRLEQRRWERDRDDLQTALLELKDTDQKRVESINRFRAELSLSRTTAGEFQDELHRLKAEFAEAQQQWQDCKESLEARLAGYAETEFEAEQRWQDERETLTAKYREADGNAQRATAELEEQRSRCADLEGANERTQTLSEQLHARDRDLHEARDALQQANDRAEALAAELQCQSSAIADVELLQQSLEQEREDKRTLAARLHESETSNTTLQSELEQLRGEMSEQHIRQIYLKAALVQNDTGDVAMTESSDSSSEATTQSTTSTSVPLPARPEPSRSRPSVSRSESTHEADESSIDLPQFVARRHGSG